MLTSNAVHVATAGTSVAVAVVTAAVNGRHGLRIFRAHVPQPTDQLTKPRNRERSYSTLNRMFASTGNGDRTLRAAPSRRRRLGHFTVALR